MSRIVKRAVALSRKNSEWYAASSQPKPLTKEVKNENKEIQKGRV